MPSVLELELRNQLADLRERLAVAQEDLISMAHDAGAIDGEIMSLKAQMSEARADRDAWREQAERLSQLLSAIAQAKV
ncbi:hypothetical protein [Methylobacterium crusticola]|nr:hypothetical protein [Methylobacterium crusticola]